MKIEALGLSQDVIRWFRSYLSDRRQLVDVSGVLSSSAEISCGVPQGSILGPLLFLIYVTDMSGAVKHKLLLYADDSAILVADKSVSAIEMLLQKELEISFGSKCKLKPQPNLQITCKGTNIQSKEAVKYLGAVLEQCLIDETMVNSIIQKANARLKFLFRKQKFLNLHSKKLLVMSLIQCHFDYACSFWYLGLIKTLEKQAASNPE